MNRPITKDHDCVAKAGSSVWIDAKSRSRRVGFECSICEKTFYSRIKTPAGNTGEVIGIRPNGLIIRDTKTGEVWND
jgi:hypothetical protein